MTRYAFLVIAALALVAAASLDRPALAQAMRATLYVVAGDLPRSLGSSDQVVRYARGHRARELHESHAPALDDREWNATVVMQFARPFTDRNMTLLFYDITERRSLVGSPMEVFVRGAQTVVTQDVTLERPRFTPNHNMEVVLTIRRQEAGRARFRIVGEERRGNGSVDFTQDDPDHTSR